MYGGGIVSYPGGSTLMLGGYQAAVLVGEGAAEPEIDPNYTLVTGGIVRQLLHTLLLRITDFFRSVAAFFTGLFA